MVQTSRSKHPRVLTTRTNKSKRNDERRLAGNRHRQPEISITEQPTPKDCSNRHRHYKDKRHRKGEVMPSSSLGPVRPTSLQTADAVSPESDRITAVKEEDVVPVTPDNDNDALVVVVSAEGSAKVVPSPPLVSSMKLRNTLEHGQHELDRIRARVHRIRSHRSTSDGFQEEEDSFVTAAAAVDENGLPCLPPPEQPAMATCPVRKPEPLDAAKKVTAADNDDGIKKETNDMPPRAIHAAEFQAHQRKRQQRKQQQQRHRHHEEEAVLCQTALVLVLVVFGGAAAGAMMGILVHNHKQTKKPSVLPAPQSSVQRIFNTSYNMFAGGETAAVTLSLFDDDMARENKHTTRLTTFKQDISHWNVGPRELDTSAMMHAVAAAACNRQGLSGWNNNQTSFQSMDQILLRAGASSLDHQDVSSSWNVDQVSIMSGGGMLVLSSDWDNVAKNVQDDDMNRMMMSAGASAFDSSWNDVDNLQNNDDNLADMYMYRSAAASLSLFDQDLSVWSISYNKDALSPMISRAIALHQDLCTRRDDDDDDGSTTTTRVMESMHAMSYQATASFNQTGTVANVPNVFLFADMFDQHNHSFWNMTTDTGGLAFSKAFAFVGWRRRTLCFTTTR